MRIRISHETTYAYAPATRWVIQNLRLTPRSFDSQYVLRWRIDVDLDGSLRHNEDSLGNVVHSFSHQKPVERLTVSAFGEVETTDAVGVVRGAVETLPPQMFLRNSALGAGQRGPARVRAGAIGGSTDTLERLHRLMGALHGEMKLDTTRRRRARAPRRLSR